MRLERECVRACRGWRERVAERLLMMIKRDREETERMERLYRKQKVFDPRVNARAHSHIEIKVMK